MKKVLLILCFLLGATYSYASDVRPTINMSHDSDNGYIEVMVQYHDNEKKGLIGVHGNMRADLTIDGIIAVKFNGHPGDIKHSLPGTLVQVGATWRDSYRHYVKYRWIYPTSYYGKTIKCRINGKWDRENADDTNVDENKSFTIPPFPYNLKLSLDGFNVVLKWEQPESSANSMLSIFRKESVKGTWERLLSNISIQNKEKEMSLPLAEQDCNKTWNYAVVLSNNSVTNNRYSAIANIKVQLPYFVGGVNINKESNEKINLSWKYGGDTSKTSYFNVFKYNKTDNKSELVKSFPLEKMSDTGEIDIPLTESDLLKEWTYIVSLSIDKTEIELPDEERSFTIRKDWAVGEPIIKELQSQLDFDTYDLTFSWKYDNEIKRDWKYAVLRKVKGTNDWEVLVDTLEMGIGMNIEQNIVMKDSLATLKKEWVYAVNLNAGRQNTDILEIGDCQDTLDVAIKLPYPKDMKMTYDTLTNTMDITWFYENPDSLSSNFKIFRKKLNAKKWTVLADSIPAIGLPFDSLVYSFSPTEKELTRDYIYAVSLINSNTKKMPLEGISAEVEQKALFETPFNWPLVGWIAIGILVLATITFLYLRKSGYRF